MPRWNNFVKIKDILRQYQTEISFSNYLPWLEWSDELNMFLLEDGVSVGSGIEIRDIGCEATTEQVINNLHSDLTNIFSKALPLYEKNPWTVQIYVQDEISLLPINRLVKSYIKNKDATKDKFVQEFLKVQEEHFDLMCRGQGIFIDPKNGLPFKGRLRRIRILLYRRYGKNMRNNVDVIKEHQTVALQFISNLKQTGISARTMQGKHFYEWWVRWFNPKPASSCGSIDKLLEFYPYIKEQKPANWHFNKDIFFSSIKSSDKNWFFDELPHNLIMFRDLKTRLGIGAISRELTQGAKGAKYSLLDKLPPGSIYTMQFVFESKNALENHLDSIEKAAIGKGQIIQKILANADRARDELNEGHMLIRSNEGIYFYADNQIQLEEYEREIKSLMRMMRLEIYDSLEEIYPLDNYLRMLPFNFNYEFDKESGRSNYKYAKDIAKLLPIYGRGRGDGQNPLYLYFNRGGEPFIFDPFNKEFKQSNSHQLLLGSSGAGKSVQLNDLIIRLSAIYNPHIIALEVGGSFDLTAMYLKEHGRNVYSLKYEKNTPAAQNPYSEAYTALDIIDREEQKLQAQLNGSDFGEIMLANRADKIADEYDNLNNEASSSEKKASDDRDILNEMLLATRIAITGGDPKEEDNIDRIDLAYINKNLINTARRIRASGKLQMIMSDVMQGFILLSDDEPNKRIKERLQGFAKKLELYINDQVRSSFVNRMSEPLGVYDFLHIDFGFLQEDTYKDLLNMVCVTLLGKILSLAEKNKSTDRFTVLIVDETHVFSKCKIIMLLLVLIAKVGRKFGLWLILATQNVDDLNTQECKKLLSIIETWICFALQKSEIEMVSHLRNLSEEIKLQLNDTMQEKGIYTEGVLIGSKYSGIFRCVPPRIALALAMTEQSERAQRVEMHQKHNITELEAVKLIAKQLENSQGVVTDAKDFY